MLDKREGPAALLNALLSYFALLPHFVFYDFSCGALRSAIGKLPFFIGLFVIVSDLFHIVNNLCNDALHPRFYSGLDGANSVAHEQRNAPINLMRRTHAPAVNTSTRAFYSSKTSSAMLWLTPGAPLPFRFQKVTTFVNFTSPATRARTGVSTTLPPLSFPRNERTPWTRTRSIWMPVCGSREMTGRRQASAFVAAALERSSGAMACEGIGAGW